MSDASRDGVRVLEVLGRSAGGVGRHVALVTRGLDVDPLSIDVACPPDTTVTMPKPLIPVEIPNGARGHARAILRLRSIVRDGSYDVVHAHGLRAGVDAGLACRKLPVKMLLSVHNVVLPEVAGRAGAAFYRWAEPLSVRLSDKTFAASEEIARRLRALAPGAAARVEVIYLGVGPAPEPSLTAPEVRAEAGIPEGGHLVVTAARLHAQKNLPMMLRAVARLAESGDDVFLAVLGEGPARRDLEVQAHALGVGERVRWLGWRGDIADFLAAADVFCLSSNWEAVALALQEAVQLGTPVVATEVGGLGELITDRVSGRLVPKDDDAALAKALHEVLVDREVAARYAERAQVELERRFSTEQMLDRLKEEYLWAAGA